MGEATPPATRRRNPFAGVLPLPEAVHWAALHTRARSEKVVARHLIREGATWYLPLARSRRVYGARVRDHWVALFPGYVFYDAARYDGQRARATDRVASVLVPPEPGLLLADLRSVSTALSVVADLPVARPLDEPGTPVEVVAGPFVGARGRLVRREKATLLYITIELANLATYLEIDEAFVRPL